MPVVVARPQNGRTARNPGPQRGQIGSLHRLDQPQRDRHHRPRVRADEHGGIANRLHQPHRWFADVAGQLGEPPGDASQLLDLDLHPQSRESHQVRKADRHVLSSSQRPSLALRAADHAPPYSLP